MPSREGLLIAFCLALLVSPLQAETIERIVAVVDQRPLLLSEVELVERVKGLKRSEAIEKAIDERLMYSEAARSPQSSVSEEEAKAAYESLLPRLGEHGAGLDQKALLALARREAVILKYVAFRFLPQIRIGDDAVRKAFLEENGETLAAPTYEASEGALRQRLMMKELDERIEAWVKELRASAEIRYNEEE